MSGKAEGAVASKYLDVGVAECGDCGASVGGERGVTFDGKNLCGKFREECGDISRAGADFEDNISGGELEGFEHDGDNIGLGDGLVVADGQRVIFVSFGTVGFGNEGVTGNAQHGVEDARVGDATGAELSVDHELAGGDGHWASCFRVLRSSWTGSDWVLISISYGGERAGRS